jgi:hypothetical protein
MEQELLDDDRRQITSARPPPTLQELQELRRTLEKTLEDHEDVERLHSILRKTETPTPSDVAPRRPCHTLHPATLAASAVLPQPPPRAREIVGYDCFRVDHDEPRDEDSFSRRRVSPIANSGSIRGTRVRKMRSTIQEARDEPFLT